MEVKYRQRQKSPDKLSTFFNALKLDKKRLAVNVCCGVTLFAVVFFMTIGFLNGYGRASAAFNIHDKVALKALEDFKTKVNSPNTTAAEKMVAAGILAELVLHAESPALRNQYEKIKQMERDLEKQHYAQHSARFQELIRNSGL